MFNRKKGWKRSRLIAPGRQGHELIYGYVRDGLALYNWSAAGQSKRRHQHWSVVLLRTGHVVLTIRGPRGLAIKISETFSTMVDWNQDAISIDRDARAAQTKLTETHGDALRFDVDFMANQEYMKWVGEHIWAIVCLARMRADEGDVASTGELEVKGGPRDSVPVGHRMELQLRVLERKLTYLTGLIGANLLLAFIMLFKLL